MSTAHKSRIAVGLRWTLALIAAPILLALLFIAIFGWNWLRGPIERATLEKTGRVLSISGDITLAMHWPLPHIQAGPITFANPPWAIEKHMLAADAVEISVDLPQLLMRKIVLPEVRLVHPVVFLEQASDGRKNWLLDTAQLDEGARVHVGLLTLDDGRIGYDDIAQKTSIRGELSSLAGASVIPPAFGLAGIAFKAEGQYKSLPVKARGSGGPVLALRDESSPYPLTIDLSIGTNRLKAAGSVTSLLKFSTIDMRLEARGESLEKLFPLLGIALPVTRPYSTTGHLLREGETWRYENFSGVVGASDIAGTAKVDTAGKRPTLSAELASNRLDIVDLGPLIGARPGSVKRAKQATPGTTTARVLPEIPFNAERWDSVNAEVTLKAKSIRLGSELPLENLHVHLSLRDSMLKLDPFTIGVAGGRLSGVIVLDGQREPMHARAQVRVKEVHMVKLFPMMATPQAQMGLVNGEVVLNGYGDSVRDMLGRANGRLGLVINGGKVSRLMMEKAGLHLWEILQLKIAGDQLVNLRCAVADFNVKDGTMQTEALVFDTEITTIVGSGKIDLNKETLQLTLNQKTKNTSPLALRSPIYIRGSFAQPDVQVDKGRVALRGLGAIALAAINPLLVLLPLVDPGPGKDRDCRQLVRDSQVAPSAQSANVSVQ